MRRHSRPRSAKAGLPPGTLVHVGVTEPSTPHIELCDYTPDHLDERILGAVQETFPFRDSSSVSWINVDGLADLRLVEKVGEHYGLHPLLMEDLVNTEQRPKFEDYGDYLFVILRMLTWSEEDRQVVSEQVGLVLGPTFLLTFQEPGGDVFGPVRERLRSGKGRIRREGADYLLYALMDVVVDGYFDVVEKLGDRLEDLEEEVVLRPTTQTLQDIQRVKRQMLMLRRAVWPLREAISSMERADSPLLKEPTSVFFRDVYDHTVQLMETVESYRDVVAGLLDIYLSAVSNRLNEVMKTLTLVSTIFLPLTFLVGVWGMNFHDMPELGLPHGYLMAWGVMLLCAGGMWAFFRSRKWL